MDKHTLTENVEYDAHSKYKRLDVIYLIIVVCHVVTGTCKTYIGYSVRAFLSLNLSNVLDSNFYREPRRDV